MKYVILIVMLVACREANSIVEETSQIELEPSGTVPAKYALEVIEIGPHAEKVLIVDGSIWILKQWIGLAEPGGLIKMSLEEPFEQQFYELPDSLGGDDMVFDGQSIWVTRNQLSKETCIVQFDPQIGQVIGQYPVNVSGELTSITFGDDIVWVSNPYNGQILKLDALNGSLIGKIEPDFASPLIAFRDNKLWAISSRHAKIIVYDAIIDKHLVTYSTEDTPSNITFDEEKAWVSHGGDTNAITLIPFTLPESLDTLSVICPAVISCNFGGVRIGENMHLIFSPSNEGIYQFDSETGAVTRSFDVRDPEEVIIDETGIWVLNGDRSRTDFGHTITRIQP